MKNLSVVIAISFLACGASFAGTANYLGTHTASDIQFGPDMRVTGTGTIEYTGGNIVFTDTGGGFVSEVPPTTNPVDAPNEGNNHGAGNGTITYTIEASDCNVGCGMYLDDQTGVDSQVWTGVFGSPPTAGTSLGNFASINLAPNGTTIVHSPDNVTFPVTFVITRFTWGSIREARAA